MFESLLCACDEVQSVQHFIDERLTTKFIGGIEQLHKGGPDALSWLTNLEMRLWITVDNIRAVVVLSFNFYVEPSNIIVVDAIKSIY